MPPRWRLERLDEPPRLSTFEGAFIYAHCLLPLYLQNMKYHTLINLAESC
ncbi:hypothetical protein AZE42_05745 [Rhizopogon vesiculosus]|uniref:Uncharacterized protein n=1 Tax=Rhizopogon vesiculosus TaxID=180088 RepID=A0A1J8PUH2_9AGAM|nr:hypothetical protein AZE42_05745 [Rhizopogon vesiculosus]